MSQPERTGWRDERISAQHRKWGEDLYFSDIDFCGTEYRFASYGELVVPAALVEYKHEYAPEVNPKAPGIRVMAELGKRAKVPFFVTRYTNDLKRYTVMPMNQIAECVTGTRTLSEADYVALQQHLRKSATWPASVRGWPTP
jgi:hypothetical protein